MRSCFASQWRPNHVKRFPFQNWARVSSNTEPVESQLSKLSCPECICILQSKLQQNLILGFQITDFLPLGVFRSLTYTYDRNELALWMENIVHPDSPALYSSSGTAFDAEGVLIIYLPSAHSIVFPFQLSLSDWCRYPRAQAPIVFCLRSMR